MFSFFIYQHGKVPSSQGGGQLILEGVAQHFCKLGG